MGGWGEGVGESRRGANGAGTGETEPSVKMGPTQDNRKILLSDTAHDLDYTLTVSG